MMEKNCMFCKIEKEELPSVKIWEDEKHFAILDINPNTEGMTLVITKEHYDSDATDMPDKEYSRLMIASKKVAKLLKGKKSRDCHGRAWGKSRPYKIVSDTWTGRKIQGNVGKRQNLF